VYIRRHGYNTYVVVVKGSNGYYIVYYNKLSGYLRCTCPASMYNKPCKHTIAVKMYIDNVLSNTEKQHWGQPKPPSST